MRTWRPVVALGAAVIFGVVEASEIIQLSHSCWIPEICNSKPAVMPHATESLSFMIGSTST